MTSKKSGLLASILLACVLALPCGRLRAATPYPFPLGSSGLEYGKCACHAPDGGMLFGILFQNTIDFDPSAGGTANRTSAGNADQFIARYAATDVTWHAESCGGLRSWRADTTAVLVNDSVVFSARDTIPVAAGQPRFLRACMSLP